MKNENNKIVEVISNELKGNLKCVILGGSRGKNNEIEGWSDYDIYIISRYLEIDSIKKIQFKLTEEINCHVGITFYTTSEIKNKQLDDKTKVMFYEKNNFNCNPTLYGTYDKVDITYDEILIEDKNLCSKIIQNLKREQILNDYRKVIKTTTVLLKIILRKHNVFSYGYKNIFKQFYEFLEKNSIKWENKIDIISCINSNEEINLFANELLMKFYDLYMI